MAEPAKFPKVETVDQVVDNVIRLNDDLEKDRGAFSSSFPSVRRWYALLERDEWLFGFSKYIGYVDMNRAFYEKNHDYLDGGDTESNSGLMKLSVPVETLPDLQTELFSKLEDFLRALEPKRKINRIATVRVLLTRTIDPEISIDRKEVTLTEAEQKARQQVAKILSIIAD